MRDAVLDGFLRDQFLRGMELAEQSDLLRLQPLFESSEPPTRYLARFNCMGVVRGDDGAIGPVESQFVVGIAFCQDHLRTADPLRVITWLDPPTVVHPNVLVPHFCAGHVAAGIELVDLLYQAFEVITYQNWSSSDALNHEAAEWARRHQHLFPLDRRPLKRRTRQTGRRPTHRGGDA